MLDSPPVPCQHVDGDGVGRPIEHGEGETDAGLE
jgi:hypothetical protein